MHYAKRKLKADYLRRNPILEAHENEVEQLKKFEEILGDEKVNEEKE